MALTPLQAVSALLFRLCPRRHVEGVPIVFMDFDIDRDMSVARMAAIFETLRQVDERYLATVKRYVRHVAIWKGHYTASDKIGGVQLASSWLMDSSDLLLASVFVHEATHLRVRRYGIKYNADMRSRIERLCVKQQAGFLRKVHDGGEDLAALYEEALESPWWTDQAHQADVEKLVSDIDIPRWLVPLLHRRS